MMKAFFQALVAVWSLSLWLAPASWAQSPVAAVLPASRSVQVGVPATAFATIINAGQVTATGCRIAPLTSLPATFTFQTTDPATNQVTGTPNTPVDIPAGAARTFVFAFTPTASFPPTEVELQFTCTNATPAPILAGVNTLLLAASDTPIPDIVALVATLTNDGVMNISRTTGAGVFAVATVNVGAGGTITASADDGGASLPIQIFICQTNPTTGACLAPPSPRVTTPIAANGTPTFGVFVVGSDDVPFDPAKNRIFVRFKDSGGVTRGSTSVAGSTEGADFKAALVRCAEVNQPTGLANCGTDPLSRGKARINKQGNVQLEFMGALPNATYQVVYRSLNGSSELSVGTVTTNPSGNGNLELNHFFPFNATGSGNFVLKRSESGTVKDEFVTGFKVAAAEEAKFEAMLIRCADVNQPTTLANCGADPLPGGKAEIGEEGKLEVKVMGAAPNASYTVVYRSLNGSTEASLGTLATDSSGNGKLEVKNSFAPSDTGSGNVVLERAGKDQFVTGFKVATAPETEFEAALVRCPDVNQPTTLANCGTDPLVRGKAEIGEEGKVEVKVANATPNASYTVVYRSLNGSTELSVGMLTTDSSGNGQLEVNNLFALNDTGSGNIVLKRSEAGTVKDQFVTGFKVTTSEDTEFEAALVRCPDVNQPTTLANCGTDPLAGGKAEINEQGKVEVKVANATPNASYTVVYRSLNGSTELSVGMLTTDSSGNGQLEVNNLFALNDTGSGNIVLKRSESGTVKDQFVTGFKVK